MVFADPIPGLTLDQFVDAFMEGFTQSAIDYQEISRTLTSEPPGYLIESQAFAGTTLLRLKVFFTLNDGYGVAVLMSMREEFLELHDPMLSQIFASFKTFPPVESSALDRSGLWVGPVSDPDLVDFLEWMNINVAPGADPDLDKWRIAIFGQSSLCTPERVENGWELSGCTELGVLPVFTNVTAFIPEQGDEGVELKFDYDSSSFAVPLVRLPKREEPQASPNVSLIWQEKGQGIHSDIWADDGLVFAPRFDSHIEILDARSGEVLSVISVPETDEGVSDAVQDVKSLDGRLYAATAFQGIVVFDISEPAAPGIIGQHHVFIDDESPENFENIHNIFMSPQGHIVYAINQSPADSDLRIIDFSDPESPNEVGRYGLSTDTGFVHDVNVIEKDDRLIAFLNYWDSGLHILDVTDPGSISVLSLVEWDGIRSHSGWPFALDDSLYFVHTEEGFDRHLTILDITDIENPEIISRFSTRANLSVHNVQVVDGIAYVSYYIDGLRVVDLRDPEEPKEIGHFDTVAASDEIAIMGQGAFGVRVVDGTVFISDMQTGTYAFQVDVE